MLAKMKLETQKSANMEVTRKIMLFVGLFCLLDLMFPVSAIDLGKLFYKSSFAILVWNKSHMCILCFQKTSRNHATQDSAAMHKHSPLLNNAHFSILNMR